MPFDRPFWPFSKLHKSQFNKGQNLLIHRFWLEKRLFHDLEFVPYCNFENIPKAIKMVQEFLLYLSRHLEYHINKMYVFLILHFLGFYRGAWKPIRCIFGTFKLCSLKEITHYDQKTKQLGKYQRNLSKFRVI